jgi:hypothetical protein
VAANRYRVYSNNVHVTAHSFSSIIYIIFKMETIHEEASIESGPFIDLSVPGHVPGLSGHSYAGVADTNVTTPAKEKSKSGVAEGEVAIETIAARKKKLKDKAKKEKEDKKKEQLEANPRELTKLTISSVSLKEVVAAHRFAKNSLWIKCSVAGNTWEVDSNDELNGSQADWTGLSWTFIRARNVVDRTELVVTVGSKEVVIGKYILAPEEFDSIPDSTYFEISGRIKSSLGKVGHVTLVCRRVEAERPKKAEPSELEDKVLPNIILLPQQDKVYIKVLRITLTELASVHVLDRNSPYCRVNCGPTWEKSTSVLVRAGANAMWDRLTWKVIMNAECQFTFTVMSLSTTIGQTVITLAEIVGAAHSRNATLIDLDRYISDGSGIVGQLNVRLQVDINHPSSEATGERPYDDVTTLDNDLEEAQRMHATRMEEMPEPGAQVTRGGKRPMQSQYTLPFNVHITSVGAYDTKPQSMLSSSNSLRINAAIGEKAYATSLVHKSGRSAEWNGLKWNFVVNKGSRLRITVWTAQKVVGHVTLDEFDLLDRPADDKGVTDIMLKMFKDGDKYRGRVRLVCEFRPYIEREEFRLLRSLRPLDDLRIEDDKTLLSEPVTVPLRLASGIEFPIVATVLSIHLYDLGSVHVLFPNSPRIKLRCDHNTAYTKELRFAGAQCGWQNLNWPVPMNEGSDLLISVLSADLLIGNWAYDPAHILRLPRRENDNVVEIIGQLTQSDYFAGRIKVLIQLQPMDAEQFRKNYPAGPIGQYILQGSEAVPIHDMNMSTSGNEAHKFGHRPGEDEGPSALSPSTPLFEDVSKMVLDPKLRGFFGFNVTLDFIEVFVSELPSVHLFKQNSPFVVAMCGKWEERTKVWKRSGG